MMYRWLTDLTVTGYEGSFIQHYLVPVIYPDGLTPGVQLSLAALVVGINAIVYGWPPVRSSWGRQRVAGQTHDMADDRVVVPEESNG